MPGNPVFVESGRRGAQKRWGVQPRVVRLDDLTADQRRLVVVLIKTMAKTEPAAIEQPAGSLNGGTSNANRSL